MPLPASSSSERLSSSSSILRNYRWSGEFARRELARKQLARGWPNCCPSIGGNLCDVSTPPLTGCYLAAGPVRRRILIVVVAATAAALASGELRANWPAR